jgi:serine/threonine protein kinase
MEAPLRAATPPPASHVSQQQGIQPNKLAVVPAKNQILVKSGDRFHIQIGKEKVVALTPEEVETLKPHEYKEMHIDGQAITVKISDLSKKLGIGDVQLNEFLSNEDASKIQPKLEKLIHAHQELNSLVKNSNPELASEEFKKLMSDYTEIIKYVDANKPNWAKEVKPGIPVHIPRKVGGQPSRSITAAYDTKGDLQIYIHLKTKNSVDMLGKGGFKKVKFAINYETGELLADAVTRLTEEGKESIEKENKYNKELQDVPHVIHYNTSTNYIDKNGIEKNSTMMPLMKGDLLKLCDNPQFRNSPTQQLRVLTQLYTAMAAMHAKGIIHHDLKEANILYYQDEKGNFNIVITDFGTCEKSSNTSVQALSAGTNSYMAPDSDKLPGYAEKKDLWALGCILFRAVYGKACPGVNDKANKFAYIESQKEKDPNVLTFESMLAKIFGSYNDRPQAQNVLKLLNDISKEVEIANNPYDGSRPIGEYIATCGRAAINGFLTPRETNEKVLDALKQVGKDPVQRAVLLKNVIPLIIRGSVSVDGFLEALGTSGADHAEVVAFAKELFETNKSVLDKHISTLTNPTATVPPETYAAIDSILALARSPVLESDPNVKNLSFIIPYIKSGLIYKNDPRINLEHLQNVNIQFSSQYLTTLMREYAKDPAGIKNIILGYIKTLSSSKQDLETLVKIINSPAGENFYLMGIQPFRESMAHVSAENLEYFGDLLADNSTGIFSPKLLQKSQLEPTQIQSMYVDLIESLTQKNIGNVKFSFMANNFLKAVEEHADGAAVPKNIAKDNITRVLNACMVKAASPAMSDLDKHRMFIDVARFIKQTPFSVNNENVHYGTFLINLGMTIVANSPSKSEAFANLFIGKPTNNDQSFAFYMAETSSDASKSLRGRNNMRELIGMMFNFLSQPENAAFNNPKLANGLMSGFAGNIASEMSDRPENKELLAAEFVQLNTKHLNHILKSEVQVESIIGYAANVQLAIKSGVLDKQAEGNLKNDFTILMTKYLNELPHGEMSVDRLKGYAALIPLADTLNLQFKEALLKNFTANYTRCFTALINDRNIDSKTFAVSVQEILNQINKVGLSTEAKTEALKNFIAIVRENKRNLSHETIGEFTKVCIKFASSMLIKNEDKVKHLKSIMGAIIPLMHLDNTPTHTVNNAVYPSIAERLSIFVRDNTPSQKENSPPTNKEIESSVTFYVVNELARFMTQESDVKNGPMLLADSLKGFPTDKSSKPLANVYNECKKTLEKLKANPDTTKTALGSFFAAAATNYLTSSEHLEDFLNIFGAASRDIEPNSYREVIKEVISNVVRNPELSKNTGKVVDAFKSNFKNDLPNMFSATLRDALKSGKVKLDECHTVFASVAKKLELKEKDINAAYTKTLLSSFASSITDVNHPSTINNVKNVLTHINTLVKNNVLTQEEAQKFNLDIYNVLCKHKNLGGDIQLEVQAIMFIAEDERVKYVVNDMVQENKSNIQNFTDRFKNLAVAYTNFTSATASSKNPAGKATLSPSEKFKNFIADARSVITEAFKENEKVMDNFNSAATKVYKDLVNENPIYTDIRNLQAAAPKAIPKDYKERRASMSLEPKIAPKAASERNPSPPPPPEVRPPPRHPPVGAPALAPDPAPPPVVNQPDKPPRRRSMSFSKAEKDTITREENPPVKREEKPPV